LNRTIVLIREHDDGDERVRTQEGCALREHDVVVNRVASGVLLDVS